jgi:(5-formylfuran-3-yl)methyl phosphate synthase
MIYSQRGAASTGQQSNLTTANWSTPGLLVSVQNGNEAAAAARGGAQVVDAKDPTAGALGRTTSKIWEEIANATPLEIPLSAALGELADFAHDAALARQLWLPERYQFAKMGLAGVAHLQNWPRLLLETREILGSLRKRPIDWVAVIYADWVEVAAPDPRSVLDEALTEGCAGILIDTVQKDGRTVFSFLSTETISQIFVTANQSGLFCALAGSLVLNDFPAAIVTGADLLAVRGAACDGGRRGIVVEENVRRLVEVLALKKVTAESAS